MAIPLNTYGTEVLNRVVASLKTPQSWLLDRYFPEVENHQTEQILFDVEKKMRRVAPFVSPLVAGKIVTDLGFSTNSFTPAYVKDKRVFDANKALKRTIGEAIGGSLSPAERVMVNLRRSLVDQMEMLTRRQEIMAAEALRLGQVTVTGDQYPTQVVSFNRDASLTVTLSGTARWGQSAAAIRNNLQDWAQIVLQLTGSMPTDVVMTVDVWKIFRADPDIQKILDLQRTIGAAPTLDLGAQRQEGGVFMGTIDHFNIFVYSGWYVDDNGAEQPILPAGTVLFTSPQVEGVRAFGAIRDEEAGLQPLSYFSKSWLEKDPSVRLLLMQSAPLVVPYRVNAGLTASVL